MPGTGRVNACLIANPAAGRGRGARRLPAVRRALAAVGIHDIRITRSPGDERRLAAEAAAAGIETIVALGGDGTWGNVARGILESGIDARLVPIAAGTGNDFPHALGLPASDPAAMATIAAGAHAVRVDLGRANDVPFLNVAGVGLEAAVLEATGRYRLLSGSLVYVAAALPLLRSFAPLRASVSMDGGPPRAGTWLAIVASNGPRFGGGFRVAPGASVTDGRLDLVSVRDARPARRLQLFVRARLGSHVSQPEVALDRIARARLEFDSPPLVDADGELHRLDRPELDLSVLPDALRVGVGEQPASR